MILGRRLNRRFFNRDVEVVARDLLGRVIVAKSLDGPVAVRLTEVEAYAGTDDAASHAFRGMTPRTEVMFGPAGHLYTYFVYGMHWCANIVTGPDGHPSAVLLRAGEVVDGLELATSRRPRVANHHLLARGPAGLATVLGFDASTNGADLCEPGGPLAVRAGTPPPNRAGQGRSPGGRGDGRRGGTSVLDRRRPHCFGVPGLDATPARSNPLMPRVRECEVTADLAGGPGDATSPAGDGLTRTTQSPERPATLMDPSVGRRPTRTTHSPDVTRLGRTPNRVTTHGPAGDGLTRTDAEPGGATRTEPYPADDGPDGTQSAWTLQHVEVRP